MNKLNTEKRECSDMPHEGYVNAELDARACISSIGSSRAEIHIPGTTIPKRFYVTITIDLEGFLEQKQKFFIPTREVLREEAKSIFITAEKQLQDYKFRYRVFKFYGCDPGAGFEVKYSFFWATTDDGIIQLLREDFLPIGTKAIDAEMAYLDGKLEEVDGVLKPVVYKK